MAQMLLIIEPTDQRFGRTESEGRDCYDRMLRFGQNLKERGLLIASESLQSQVRATRVQCAAGVRRSSTGRSWKPRRW